MKAKNFTNLQLLVIAFTSRIVNYAGIVNASRDFAKDEELLKGKHFIIGTIMLPPYISYQRDVNGKLYNVDGFVHQIVLYLAEKYQFTFEYVESPAWGAFVNGSWNGLIGLLQRGEIDLVATGLTVTYPRSKVVDFSVPFMDDPISMLIPYPEIETTSIIGIVKPFRYEVWLLIFITCIMSAAALWFISLVHFSWFKIIVRSTFAHNFWILFRILANAGTHSSRILPSLPVRIVVAGWCLVAVVLVNAYSCVLTSYLMTPQFHPMIDSVEDIVAIPRPIFMVQRYTSFESLIMESESGTALAKIAESVKNNQKELSLLTLDHIADIIVKEKRSFTQEVSTLLTMIEQDFKETGTCRLSLASKPWGIAHAAFALNKTSQSITELFNQDIIWLRQVGLLEYWRQGFWPRPNRCSDQLGKSQISSSHKDKLTLNYLSSAFLLLIFGICLSITVYVIELLSSKALSKRIGKRNPN